MLGALTVLLLYQLLGEVLVHVLALPVPGPVVGMLALFLTLMVRGALSAPLRETANGILQHLSLLFVPAGTGVRSISRAFPASGCRWSRRCLRAPRSRSAPSR